MIPAGITGAVTAVVLGATTAGLLTSGGENPPAASAAGPTPSAAEPAASPSTSPSVLVSPSPAPSPVEESSTAPAAAVTRSPQPSTAELVNGIRSTVRRLERGHQISDEAARSLDQQLREITRAAGAGNLRRAREVLAAVGAAVDDLHANGPLTDAGYREIATGLTALARLLAAS